MQILDSFLHPVIKPSEDGLFNISNDLLFKNLEYLKKQMSFNKIVKSNVILFNNELVESLPLNYKDFFYFSVLANFREYESDDYFEILIKKNVKNIVFHPYLQNIKKRDWNDCVEFVKKAERLEFIITICTAYGSKKIYDIDILPFALHIANNVKSPIIFSHCGGLKILDAMLIAENFKNIYFDTSFSLSYWVGSSVEKDIAFVINKIGVNRFLFGSDFPFVDMSKAIEDQIIFLNKWKFSSNETELVMKINAEELFSRFFL